MKRDQIRYILMTANVDKRDIDRYTDSILIIFGIIPEIILKQEWEEDEDGNWSTWGWFYENDNIFDDVGYEMEQILSHDKYGHITKAKFKYIG